MSKLRRIATLTLAALAVAAPLQAGAQAQAWPTKPVRIVIGYGPGSGADIEARFVGNYLEQTYKQAFLIEAKPGAGTIIGTDYVAKSAPDGYTLFMSTAAPTTFPALMKSIPFDLLRDFDPISNLNDTSPVLLANKDIPVKNLVEFVAYAKANQGKLNYGSAGRNSILLMVESLKLAAGIQMAEIPYNGQAAYLTALIRNDVQLVMASASAAKPLVDSGQVKVLAAFGSQRVPNMPDVSTVGEQGFPTLRGGGWYGLLAPHGTPREIVDKIAAEMPRYAATPAQKERAVKGGFTWITSTPAQFREQLTNEIKFWSDIAQKANIKPE
jgi:tripartite-type tricarboxylate transporter receptor subunit TctC